MTPDKIGAHSNNFDSFSDKNMSIILLSFIKSNSLSEKWNKKNLLVNQRKLQNCGVGLKKSKFENTFYYSSFRN